MKERRRIITGINRIRRIDNQGYLDNCIASTNREEHLPGYFCLDGKGRIMNLQNKVAVITGSSSGIGEGVALLFAKEGAKVVVNSNTNRAEGKR